LVADLAAKTAVIGQALHPQSAANLAELVRLTNTYYSNLIEGHNTRPRDIERALRGDLDQDATRRDLQTEAAAHVRVQARIDQMYAQGTMPDPASADFVRWLHREFYLDAPDSFLQIRGAGRDFTMVPGEWRSRPEHDVEVGRHLPPSSARVSDFMNHFAKCFAQDRLTGRSSKIIAIAIAHHRLNFIHPFPDGNGRVSRLMSHAMASAAGIGAHGLWSVSRGLARGLDNGPAGRNEYKSMMDHADSPRQNDLDGRGNLSEKALIDFVEWFLRICIDQVEFMTEIFDLKALQKRLRAYVERDENLKPEAARLLEEALIRGEFERGESSRITGLPERTARRVLKEVETLGLLASNHPKGPVSLRFPTDTLEILFPKLF
jgi:Fic family protein